MLLRAIGAEVADNVETHQQDVDQDGRRLVVRNGYARERSLVTGVGTLRVKAPRVEDRRVDEQGRKFHFTSQILPPYLRRTKSVEELIPWLYLKGISTGDFSEALAALLGPDAPGLSATTVVRLKQVWRGEYETWSKRSLAGQRFVYVWADGIYSNIRLDDERQCLLVVMGALEDGRKQLLAVHDGFRESELSWCEVLEDLKRRGLELPPKLAVGDGGLGFWAALRKVYPTTREQRCWVHKTANVLDKLPKSMQGKAKQALHDIYLAESRQAATEAFESFVELYEKKFPKAVACLEKDREALLTFYDFPAEHWGHLRTTNPIESTFATVRLRQRRTKGCGSREASLTMAFMLARQAERHWRRLNGSDVIVHVLEGKQFKDGELVQDRAA
jgi:transposase-like protein